MTMAFMSPTKRNLLLGFTILLVISGVALILTKNAVFMGIFKSQLVLSPTSGSYPMWQILPEPMVASMYLFKVLNPDEIRNGKKPRLEQVGPYVFTEQHEKTDIVWNNNNDTVSYKQIRTWHFLPERSNGTLDDEVTILNSMAASLGPMIQLKVPPGLILGMNLFLKYIGENLFVTKPVREILFEGYHDPLLDDIESLEKFLPFIKKLIPPGSITEKFAFFYNRNTTDDADGVFNVYTGAGDVTKMGSVATWNYDTHKFFNGTCGKVHGSAGEFYSPGIKKDHIELYSNDLCRSIRLNYDKEVKVEGINSYEYVADHSFFANGTENPANACFQPDDVPLRSGVYNVSMCRFGAPVFVSQPHFYQADPYYGSLVEGLKPNEELHSTYFRVEPRSGIPTDVKVRVQINVMLAPVKGIALLEGVSTSFFPVVWFENSAGVPKSCLFKMSLLANLPDILSGMGWADIGLAISIIIMVGICFVSRKREDDNTPLLTESLMDESGDENVFAEKEDRGDN